MLRVWIVVHEEQCAGEISHEADQSDGVRRPPEGYYVDYCIPKTLHDQVLEEAVAENVVLVPGDVTQLLIVKLVAEQAGARLRLRSGPRARMRGS